jgi:hypothetical protein
MVEFEESEGDTDEPLEVDLATLGRRNLNELPDHLALHVLDNNFPECTIWREGRELVIQVEEHIYTKYWEHKFHGRVFADAMVRAVLRLGGEGHPVGNPQIDSDDDVHIFVRWQLTLPADLGSEAVIEAIGASFDLVWRRANSILENSDSVLILGKDSGIALERLKKIASILEQRGYYTYIIREQPDRLGESLIQKVLRHALSSKFIVVENSEPSGHLYELPHVAKLAECVTIILQEEGTGATWMFEDAFFKHRNLKRFSYRADSLERVLVEATVWAEKFFSDFGEFQAENLPWLQKGTRP